MKNRRRKLFRQDSGVKKNSPIEISKTRLRLPINEIISSKLLIASDYEVNISTKRTNNIVSAVFVLGISQNCKIQRKFTQKMQKFVSNTGNFFSA